MKSRGKSESSTGRQGPDFVIDTDWDVPYLAGYSADEQRVYIDQRVPMKLKIGEHSVNVHDTLALHEEVEKDLIDKHGLDYQQAHQLATLVEHGYLTQLGVSPKAYEAVLAPYIKRCQEEFKEVPPDLDLTPYTDSKDLKLVAKIQALQSRTRKGS